MAGTHDDAVLVVELAKWGAMSAQLLRDGGDAREERGAQPRSRLRLAVGGRSLGPRWSRSETVPGERWCSGALRELRGAGCRAAGTCCLIGAVRSPATPGVRRRCWRTKGTPSLSAVPICEQRLDLSDRGGGDGDRVREVLPQRLEVLCRHGHDRLLVLSDLAGDRFSPGEYLASFLERRVRHGLTLVPGQRCRRS